MESSEKFSSHRDATHHPAEGLLERISAMSKIGWWELDVRTMRLFWSPETYRIHEVEPNLEASVAMMPAFYAPEARPKIEAMIQAGLEQGTPWDYELPLTTAKGRTIWVKGLGSAVMENGKAIRLTGSFQDITNRKQDEAALRESEETYRLLFESVQDALFVSELDESGALGKFLMVNDTACSRLGYSREEFFARTPFDIVSEKSKNSLGSRIRKILEDQHVTVEAEHVSKDGKIIPVEISTSVTTIRDRTVFYSMARDITERKQADQALKELSNRLELATSSANLGIWDWDLVSNTLVWDEQMFRLYGATADTAVDGVEIWQKGVHPDDFAEAWEACQAAIRGEKKYDTEFRVQHPEGTVRLIKADGIVIREANGTAVRMIGINHDITERKLAEEKIREKDIQFRKLSANVPDLIYQFTRKPDGSYCVPIASEGIMNIFGCLPEDVLEDFAPIGRVIHPDDAARVLDDIEYSAKHLTYFTCEFRVQIPGKEIQWIYSRSAPEKLSDGSITWYGFNTDITEMKRAEEVIAKEREQLAVTLRSIGDGVITTDTRGMVVLMNKVAEELIGRNQNEAIGQPIASVFNILHEKTHEPHENPVQEVLATGQIIELADPTLLVGPDGAERIITFSGAPINDKNSVTIGTVLVFRDVTDKQKLVETSQRNQQLESLGILAGGIAHDFNNLMGGLFGYIDLANEESSNSNVTKYLSKAMTTIERARGLTGQLLTFAKGGAPLQDIGPLFPFVEETAKFALSGANVSCRFDVPQNLWACNYDQNQIGQVIDNIIINAQQAMPTGGSIDLTARNVTIADKMIPSLAAGNYVKISVKDRGIGIPKKLIGRIFDPFFTTKTKGHGLGLASCHSIVSRHGGCIEVESEPDQGSTFHIFLPAVSDTVLTSGENPAKAHQGTGTFLIMDDEEVMRETIRGMLQSFGYSVVCKENGREAVDFFNDQTAMNGNIVGMIFDLTIPGGMGGEMAAVEIRKVNQEIPIFVASGYAEDLIMKVPNEFGFTASLCKPFRRSELEKMLNKWF